MMMMVSMQKDTQVVFDGKDILDLFVRTSYVHGDCDLLGVVVSD